LLLELIPQRISHAEWPLPGIGMDLLNFSYGSGTADPLVRNESFVNGHPA